LLYDLLLAFGFDCYRLFKKDVIRYHFFSDPIDHGADAIFGLDFALMQLVDVFRSAAEGYGTDRRILLLHGPVGSSKSTIARLLKKGIEAYSKTDAGALYSFSWLLDEHCAAGGKSQEFPCPMHEEPLILVPKEAREDILNRLNEKYVPQHRAGRLRLVGDLCPFCRKVYAEMMRHYGGGWRPEMEHSKHRPGSPSANTRA